MSGGPETDGQGDVWPVPQPSRATRRLRLASRASRRSTLVGPDRGSLYESFLETKVPASVLARPEVCE